MNKVLIPFKRKGTREYWLFEKRRLPDAEEVILISLILREKLPISPRRWYEIRKLKKSLKTPERTLTPLFEKYGFSEIPTELCEQQRFLQENFLGIPLYSELSDRYRLWEEFKKIFENLLPSIQEEECGFFFRLIERE